MKKKLYWHLLQLDKIGGTEMVTIFLANHLCEYYDITIISSAKITKNVYDIDPRIKVISLNYPLDMLTLDQSSVYYWQTHQYLKLLKVIVSPIKFVLFKRHEMRNYIGNLIKKDDATLICSSIDSYWLAPKKGRVLFHFHFNDILYETFLHKLTLGLSRKPDKTIFLSKDTMDKVVSNHPNLQGKATYITNPCRINNQLDLTTHNHALLFLARFADQKNPLFAIKIAKALKEKGFNFTLTMCGHGSLEKYMMQDINKYKLNDVVKIIPVSYDVETTLKQYDLLLIPSKFEGFGLTIAEANAMSVPVISSNWGDGVHAIIDEGENGYIIDEFDENKYADKIIEVLSNEEEFKKLKASSCKHNERFSIDNILPIWQNLLDETDK